MKKSIILVAVFSVALAVAVVYYLRPREEFGYIPGVRFSVLLTPDNEYEGSVTNDTGNTISYFGYGGEGRASPVYSLRIVHRGFSHADHIGWCGVGMGPCDLAAGQTLRFPLYNLSEKARRGDRIHVVMSFKPTSRKLWNEGTKPIELRSEAAVFR